MLCVTLMCAFMHNVIIQNAIMLTVAMQWHYALAMMHVFIQSVILKMTSC